MKTKLVAAIFSAVIIATGCVSTPDGKKQAGVPFIKDKIEGQYKRSPDQVYAAAKAVIVFNGVLLNETTVHGETNTVRVVEGKVNQRSVWIRIAPLDAEVTSVIVQARTKLGGSDFGLIHELEKQIALKLAQ